MSDQDDFDERMRRLEVRLVAVITRINKLLENQKLEHLKITEKKLEMACKLFEREKRGS
jgi:hypothetical protein